MHDPDQVSQNDKNQSSLLDHKQPETKAPQKSEPKTEDHQQAEAENQVAINNKRTLTAA
jgi:hypothetical protein